MYVKKSTSSLPIMTKSFECRCDLIYFHRFRRETVSGSTVRFPAIATDERTTVSALKVARSWPFEWQPFFLSIEICTLNDNSEEVSFVASTRYIVVDVPPRLPAISGRDRWVMCCTAPGPPPSV